MDANTGSNGCQVQDEEYVFDFGSLYAAFEELTDKRQECGKCYTLALVLVLIVLAKLCGHCSCPALPDFGKALSRLSPY